RRTGAPASPVGPPDTRALVLQSARVRAGLQVLLRAHEGLGGHRHEYLGARTAARLGLVERIRRYRGEGVGGALGGSAVVVLARPGAGRVEGEPQGVTSDGVEEARHAGHPLRRGGELEEPPRPRRLVPLLSLTG